MVSMHGIHEYSFVGLSDCINNDQLNRINKQGAVN